MVISVKSRKILTCIDLHHTVSLNGGLDGCSSVLKVQYSQSTPKLFGKKIILKKDCKNCSERIHCERQQNASYFNALDAFGTSVVRPRKTSEYNHFHNFSWLSFCHLPFLLL